MRNIETETNIKVPGLNDAEFTSFGVGTELDLTLADFTVHYEHESTESTEH